MLKMMIAVAVLTASPALAQEASKVSAEKKACRATYATGSIMSVRICHTRSEWASIDAANQRMMDNRINSNTVERSQGGAGDHTDSFGQSNH